MKKILVLLAVMVLVSSSAFAAITGSAHDLSSNNTTGSDEVCVFCHTPHGGGTDAPLWNRTSVAPTAVYTSGSFNATASTTAGDAKLCLSCHSGTAVSSALVNPSNAAGANPGSGLTIGASTDIGTDLANDHPVGFDYSASDADDAEVKAIDDAGVAALLFPGGEMWCSSCHDVHDNTDVPFLVMSNSGSALCLTCHIK